MSTPPPEDLKIYFEKFIKNYTETSDISTEIYENIYYKKYSDKLKIIDRSKINMVEKDFYNWKHNPYINHQIKEHELFGGTNTDGVEEPVKETPEEDLQYFNPKDLDI